MGISFDSHKCLEKQIISKVCQEDIIESAREIVEFFKAKSRFRFNFGSIKRGLYKHAIDDCLNNYIPEGMDPADE